VFVTSRCGKNLVVKVSSGDSKAKVVKI